MKEYKAGYYADIFSLVTALLIALLFIFAPFNVTSDTAGLGVSLPAIQLALFLGDETLMDLLGSRALSNQIAGIGLVLMSVLILSLVAALAAALALARHEYSKVASYIVAVCGAFTTALLLFYFIIIVVGFQEFFDSTAMGYSVAFQFFGFGFWLIMLGGLSLIFQVFVRRQLTARDFMVPPTGFSPYGQASYLTPVRPSSNRPQYPMPQVPYAPPQPPTMLAPQMPATGQMRASAWLVNSQTNQNFQLLQGDTRIGRSTQRNDIVLNSTHVSREHALIRTEGMHFVLYTIGARAPLYVNGVSVSGRQVLNANDRITFGDLTLQFIRA